MLSARLPLDEAARLRAVRDVGLLDTPAEPAFDDLARLAACICGTPIALITLVDEARQWFKSRVGLEAEETSREIAFCAHAILEARPLVVPDATADERFADNPLVTGELHLRFYAGIPLAMPRSGLAIGTLCVIDRVPRALAPEQLSALAAIARQVLAQLELRRHATELERLQALKDDLFALVLHDVRNPLAGVLGYLELLHERTSDPSLAPLRGIADQAMLAAENLRQLVEGILEIRALEEGALNLRLVPVAVADLVRAAVTSVGGTALARRVAVQVGDTDCARIVADGALVRRAIENLLTNAIRFSPAHETVSVSVAGVGRLCEVVVADRGPGISAAARSCLFQKFRTAGEEQQRPRRFGLGLYLVRLVAEAHGGEVAACDNLGGGTRIQLRLPIAGPDAP